MYAAGDEQRIGARCNAAGNIGAHRIANRQGACRRDCRLAYFMGHREDAIVDRRTRLAGPDYFAARLLIALRDCAGAIDQVVAAFHDKIGIGANHVKPLSAHAPDQLAIVIRRLGLVVIKTGVENDVGVFRGSKADVQTVQNAKVAFGAEMKHRPCTTIDQRIAREIARGEDRIARIGGYGEPFEHADNGRAWPRRVGEKDHGPSAGAELLKRFAGKRPGTQAVVDDAPDIADQQIVTGNNRAEAIKAFHGDFRPWRR